MIEKPCRCDNVMEAADGPRAMLVPLADGDNSYIELKLTEEERGQVIVGREYTLRLLEVGIDAEPEPQPADETPATEPDATAPDPDSDVLHPDAPLYSVDNLPSEPEDWPKFRKTAETHALRIDGPFRVETSESENEPFLCEDGYLAVDSRGYPYAIAVDEFEQIYEPAEGAELDSVAVDELNVDGLREELAKRDLSTEGKKPELVARLTEALAGSTE